MTATWRALLTERLFCVTAIHWLTCEYRCMSDCPPHGPATFASTNSNASSPRPSSCSCGQRQPCQSCHTALERPPRPRVTPGASRLCAPRGAQSGAGKRGGYFASTRPTPVAPSTLTSANPGASPPAQPLPAHARAWQIAPAMDSRCGASPRRARRQSPAAGAGARTRRNSTASLLTESIFPHLH